MNKRCYVLAVPLFLSVFLPSSTHAGQNAGGHALLSWNATSQVTDVAGKESPFLYIRFTDVKEFKGAEIDLVWSPPGNQENCFTIVGATYRTATNCTYLNRGVTVPIVVADEPGYYHVAWANSDCATCTEGAALWLQLDNAGCADVPGCFHLTQALVLDCKNDVDVLTVGDASCSVNGGDRGPYCPETPVQPVTWGGIKTLYR